MLDWKAKVARASSPEASPIGSAIALVTSLRRTRQRRQVRKLIQIAKNPGIALNLRGLCPVGLLIAANSNQARGVSAHF